MKKLLASLALLLAATGAAAQPRLHSQAELDSLLAPVALYPDSLLHQILGASAYPQQVQDAAQWSRANPGLSGDAAVEAVAPYAWHPSVAALVAFPDVLTRMAEKPQWLRDLGEAWRMQEAVVLDTVQQLRQRAEAAGNLQSDEHQRVYRDGTTIVVEPAYQEVVYVRYYDPFVVYGTWWWPAFYPVFWRPFVVHPVHWGWAHHHHHGHHHHRPQPKPVHTHKPAHSDKPVYSHRPVHGGKPVLTHKPQPHHRPGSNGAPSPAARMQAENTARYIQQHQQQRQRPAAAAQVRQMPAPAAFSQQRPAQVAAPQRPAQVAAPQRPAQVVAPQRAAPVQRSAPPRFQAQQQGRRGGRG